MLLPIAFASGIAYGQDFRDPKLVQQTITLKDEFRIEIQIPHVTEETRCGLRIQVTPDEKFDLRIGVDPHRGKNVVFQYKPKIAGSYKFEVKGQFLTRGLNSLAPCRGEDVSLSGRVVDHELLRTQLNQGLFEEALRTFERDFKDPSVQALVEQDLRILAAAFRDRYFKDLSTAIAAEVKSREDRLHINSLANYLNLVRAIEQIGSRYSNISIIQKYANDDPLIDEYKKSIAGIREALSSNLSEIYTNFPHSKAIFSRIYPYPFDEARIFSEWEPKFLQLVDHLHESELENLLFNTRGAWLNRPETRRHVANRILRSSSQSPIKVIQAKSRLTTFGLSERDFLGFPKIYGGWSSGQQQGVDVSFVGLHDTALKSSADLSRLQGSGTDFVLIWVDSVRSPRNIVNQSRIESTFKAGQRQVVNPQYHSNQIKCQTAQQDLAKASVRNTLNPSANRFGALLQGLGEVALQQARDQACGEFSRTPIQISEDVFRPYTYNITDIRLDRETVGRIISYSTKSGISVYPFEERESKSYRVVSGRHRDDLSPNHGLVSEADLDRDSSLPVTINAPKLIDRITADGVFSAPRSTLASVVDGRTSPSTAGPAGLGASQRQVRSTETVPAAALPSHVDPRTRSVVIVRTADSLGTGFYVEPNRIITNAHVVGSTSTISLETVSGEKFTGVVRKRDIGRDLALIEVTKLGQPVELAGHIVRQGDTVEAIGHPRGLFFSLTRGVVSALRRHRLETGADHVQIIQMDTTIAPGNSGGPLYSKDKVIGINTFQRRDSSGLNFAVHSSEIAIFLADVR